MKGTIVAEGRYLRLIERGGWEFVARRNTTGIVVLVAVTDEGRLVLVEQWREPVGARVIELPAGLAGDIPDSADEALAVAAQRELVEETGYEARELEHVVDAPSSPGLTSETYSIFRARGLVRVSAGGGDASEDIVVYEVPLAGAEAWLAERAKGGTMVDLKVYAGLFFARS